MGDKFAVSEEYQQKVLSYGLYNFDFASIASEVISAEDFGNKPLQWYYEKIIHADTPLSPISLKEELLTAAKAGKIKEHELDKYVELYKEIVKKPLPHEEDHIKVTFNRFIKVQATKRAVIESLPLIEEGRWEEITEAISAATQKGMDVLSLGQDYFTDLNARLARRAAFAGYSRLSTGIPTLDEALNGGIKEKQLGLIVGATGRGKSLFLEWLARIAILHGKKVVYYTLEMPEDDIAARFDSMFARIKMQELSEDSKAVFDRVSDYARRFGTSLIIKEYPADECSVRTIKSHIKQLNAAGFVPDLIIVDYLDLLKPHRRYNSMYEEYDSITKALHGLSKSLNTRIWTATQFNRAGITSDTPDEAGISGSTAKLFTPDVVLFLAQSKEEREDEKLRLLVNKNRNGRAGQSIDIDTEFSYMTFYRAAASVS